MSFYFDFCLHNSLLLRSKQCAKQDSRSQISLDTGLRVIINSSNNSFIGNEKYNEKETE